MIRVLQLNMQRSRTANDLLYRFAAEQGSDILLLSEQYQNRRSPQWISDLSGTAAIWILDLGKVPVLATGSGNGFVWVRSRVFTFFSCYLTPNQPIADYRRMIDSLEDEILNIPGGVIIGGDFNARAVEWGSSETNTRGRYVLDMAARTGLHILNTGGVSTFRRPGYGETIPDISLVTEGFAHRVTNWKVCEDYSASDHQAILFKVLSEQATPEANSAPLSRRWNVRRLDKSSFEDLVKNKTIENRRSAEELATATMSLISSACEQSMPAVSGRRGKKPVYWWTPEIAELRKRCLGLRRAAQRARNRPEANARSAEHRAARRELRRAINRSKVRCWKQLCQDIDNDPWGMGYRIVTQKLGARSPPAVMEPQAMSAVVNTLFPTHALRPVREFGDLGAFPPFREEELVSAVRSLRNQRAPGPDGIPSEILKLVTEINPSLLLDMFNACLADGVFHSSWKMARLVLIPKAKAATGTPSSFRPLCMLDTTGKVLEKLIRARLTEAIVSAGDLSPQQHGFRSGHSTIDAIQEVVHAVRRAEDHTHWSRRVVLLVTLDVKNAFNSARWSDMLRALEHTFHVPAYLLRMIEAYLTDRVLLYDTTEGQRRVSITSGAAQGSILGPDLWNVSYDSLLRLDMPDESLLVGYADDVAALIAARNVDQANLKLGLVMARVNAWMAAHGLSLAISKTEIVVLTKKRIPTVFPVQIGDVQLETKPAAKYLGVMIDNKLSFGEQVRHTADKAAKAVAALGRLMPNIGGPLPCKRRLLMSSVQSVLLYGAEVWAHALEKRAYRDRLSRVQRRGALRVASAYRTVSEPAVMVIAGVLPIHHLARERQVIYRRKAEGRDIVAREERDRSFERWQREWEAESRGRWTFTLIPDVRTWVERQHGEVDYYLTQLLSGHGYFKAYLHKIGKVASPACLYCPGVTDTARHTFFDCNRWHARRASLFAEIGVDETPENIVGAMLQGEDNWNCVKHYVQSLLRAKKVDLDRP